MNQYSHSRFLMVAVGMIYLLLSFYFQSLCIFQSVCIIASRLSPIEHMVRYCMYFLSNLTTSDFWLDCLIHLHLMPLLIYLDLCLPFYFLFSMCLMPFFAHLFLLYCFFALSEYFLMKHFYFFSICIFFTIYYIYVYTYTYIYFITFMFVLELPIHNLVDSTSDLHWLQWDTETLFLCNSIFPSTPFYAIIYIFITPINVTNSTIR